MPNIVMTPSGMHVLETCLYANDLAAAERFYVDVLGFRLVSSMGDRGRVFRVHPEQVLIVFDPKETRQSHAQIPSHGAIGEGHAAFAIDPARLSEWRNHLTQCGVDIEQEVDWPSGAKSLYFRDPAGNSLEIAAGDIWPA